MADRTTSRPKKPPAPTEHPPWCDQQQCATDYDGSELHLQTLVEIPTHDGPLSVGLSRMKPSELTVDLITDGGDVACLTVERARMLRDLLDERIRLASGEKR